MIDKFWKLNDVNPADELGDIFYPPYGTASVDPDPPFEPIKVAE